MLTTLVISCCLVFIFLQLTNPYISLAKNAIKHTTTETYLISYRLANCHYGIMGDATTPIQVQKGGVPP